MKNLPRSPDFVRPTCYNGGMQMMKVTDLMNTVIFGDFGHSDWAAMINDKAADPGFWRLVEDIERDGITRPIEVRYGEIRNGHHRLAAAILLALDEVPVAEGYRPDFDGYPECWAYDNDGVAVEFYGTVPLDLYEPDVVDSW